MKTSIIILAILLFGLFIFNFSILFLIEKENINELELHDYSNKFYTCIPRFNGAIILDGRCR